MNKILLGLKSRTVWTIIALFVINGFQGISSLVPPAALDTINAILGVVAIYFKINPSQNYNTSTASIDK